MKWTKTSEQLPPIGEYIITCRYMPKDEWQDENTPEYIYEIMSLYKKEKNSDFERWITWHSIDRIVYQDEKNRPLCWMPFPKPPVE